MRIRSFGCAVSAIAVAVVATAPAYAQETTSTIRGTVTANGGPIAGATLTITHIPSGTRTTVVTNGDGAYAATGLRIGGPFTVAVSASGFPDYQVTDINTSVGQPFALPIELAQGDVIVVTATKVKGAGSVSQGPVNVLTANDISKVASVNRDIRDLMQRDPFANLDTSSSTGRNVSFAGQNPRFNRFTIDGVPITDSFGLNPDALPSRRGPVPLDAIEQFETKVAPYDVREGFFQGGVVNAILKSGTNEFHGTAFYSYSSDELQGDRTKSYITNLTGKITVPNYTSKDYGAQISGPIIPDKLFFMIAGERVRASLPVARGTTDDNAGAPVTNLTSATVARIQQIAKTVYNYDTGGILRNNGDKDDRLVGKLDANLSETQRLALTGIYTKDELITPTTNSNTQLGLESNAYTKPNRVYAGVLQLNSDWSSNFSTEARVLYKDYKSGQIPLMGRAAQFSICTAENSDRAATGTATSTTLSTACPVNVPQVIVGPGGPSQSNILTVKTKGASLLGRLTAGDHSFRAFGEFQHSKTFNLFVNPSAGTYYFDSIADFQARRAQLFNYNNAPSLDPNDAAAKFEYSTFTFGLQDQWRVTNTLNVALGARYDLFGGNSRPALNPVFVNRYGFSNNNYINGLALFQPRFGFDWKPLPRLSIRGGGGIFGGGSPDVYIGNSFSNTGVLNTSITARQTDSSIYQLNSITNPVASTILNNVDINNISPAANTALQTAAAGLTTNNNTTTTLNALDPNFKLPSQWRATVSATYDFDLGGLGDHWYVGGDLLYSSVRNQVIVRDIRSVPIVGTGATTPDGRTRYRSVITATPTDTNADYLLTNTKQGRGLIAVARINKSWDFGLSAGGSFTYQNVKDAGALTSSIAGSNYNNGAYYQANVGGYGHSNDEVRYAFKYNVSFEHAFFGDYKTRIDIFGDTREGSPYSYTFRDVTSRGNTGNVFGTVGTNTRYLMYVPTANDPLVAYDSVATQTFVENLISTTGLSKYRGKVAPRNAFRSKWFTKMDLHFEQQIPTFLGSSRITLFGDIENFTNLLNKKWGQQLRSTFPYNKTPVSVTCRAVGTNPCGQYVYSTPTAASVLADELVTANGSSLYAIRVGARFSF